MSWSACYSALSCGGAVNPLYLWHNCSSISMFFSLLYALKNFYMMIEQYYKIIFQMLKCNVMVDEEFVMYAVLLSIKWFYRRDTNKMNYYLANLSVYQCNAGVSLLIAHSSLQEKTLLTSSDIYAGQKLCGLFMHALFVHYYLFWHTIRVYCITIKDFLSKEYPI